MKLRKIIQKFDDSRIAPEAIERHVKNEFEKAGLDIPSGGRVAVAVGSRGIRNLPRIVRASLDCIIERGGRPFIVPAMGSHGGADAEGQKAVLAGYGITEEALGVPVVSSMEVCELPSEGLPISVFMDKNAYEADAVFVINRVKPHTAFHGPVESGLLKMCAVGLGKHRGASELHGRGVSEMGMLISEAARKILEYGNVIGGAAIAENAYEETALLRVLPAADFHEEEPKILEWVRGHMPSLPVGNIDVLLVEEFGKDISGSGMDVNIIGRMYIDGVDEPEYPHIGAIVLLDLTEKSRGNASGMGLADVITRRFREKIDFHETYENVLTHGFFRRGKMPVVAESDDEALEYALKYCRISDPSEARIVRIKNTLELSELWVSEAAARDLEARKNIEVTR